MMVVESAVMICLVLRQKALGWGHSTIMLALSPSKVTQFMFVLDEQLKHLMQWTALEIRVKNTIVMHRAFGDLMVAGVETL
jgi:hypothetical protein